MPIEIPPTVSRGINVSYLQPYYYYSSLFVDPMREDIKNLLAAYATAYTAEPLEPDNPFALFKITWKKQGWDIAHLKSLDQRARPVFIKTVMRLFIGE